ncbi:MAG: flavodoxin family protein [Bacteroidaceae bacterium]|nr:flavodoxin family protein [Bacteroidaceae bacterium]
MDKITRRTAIKKIGHTVAAAAICASGAEALAACAPTTKNARKMKVLLINGSPRANGNTYRMLQEAASQLQKNGIGTEIVQTGAKAIRGCIACGQCSNSRCVFDDDICNGIIAKMEECDGLIVGSPVYYGVPTGQVISLIQRMAYAGGAALKGKPVSAVTVCRRGGATAAFQTLQMPFQMLNMPIVTSQYWNIGYGLTPGQIEQDAEGLQTMRTMADNMAYMLHQFQTGTAKTPERERGIATNFI